MSSVPRFFVPPDALSADGSSLALPPEAAHHAVGVLRLRAGEPLIVHDGRGNAYRCRLDDGATAKRATARVESSGPVGTEPRTRVTVAQALPKTSDKIEQVLQHGTEVGAAGFAFWAAARSVARLADGEKIEKRLSRWRGIVRGAAEQSGRGVLPDVAWLPFAPDVARASGGYDAALVLHESADAPLRAVLEEPPVAEASRLLVIVGPEGGLTEDDELPLFAAGGARVVSLGPRVLRTETAALVALAQILYHRGE